MRDFCATGICKAPRTLNDPRNVSDAENMHFRIAQTKLGTAAGPDVMAGSERLPVNFDLPEPSEVRYRKGTPYPVLPSDSDDSDEEMAKQLEREMGDPPEEIYDPAKPRFSPALQEF